MGLDYITPSNEFLTLAGKAMCRDKAPTQIICENLLFLIMGYTSDQLNTVRSKTNLLKCFAFAKNTLEKSAFIKLMFI